MPVCPVCEAPVTCAFDELYSCARCGHLCQLPPAIRVVYNGNYVAQYRKLEARESMSHLRLGLLKSFCEAGTLLDVGYGGGDFVRLALKAGYDAYGVDVHGVDCGVRERSMLEHVRWDVVTFFDSLEHFADLDLVRQLIERALFVMVSMPKVPKFRTAEELRSWRHYKPGEHLHYFSYQSLDRLLWPKQLLSRSDAEDAIRGRCAGAQNIFTSVYGA